jgi:hypothetical protein
MPNKYPEKKGWFVPKQKYKVNNWAAYNQALRNRGGIEFWMSDEAIEQWEEPTQINNGTGSPKKFSNLSIMICHEIRQVYKLALRQCEGFINSIFKLMKLPITCPDYSSLSKRLSKLKIKSPRYKNSENDNAAAAAIAIDSSGLRRFGHDEWHQEKHKIAAKRSWRKLHIAVDTKHIIHACELTDRFVSDENVVGDLSKQIDIDISQITADGAYDNSSVYEMLSSKFPNVDIIIPPSSDAIYNIQSHKQRNRNLQEIKTFGRMNWQKIRKYGNRNYSELCIQRYKKILGNKMHSRELTRQKNEAMIGCGVLNKMTNLGMPLSYKSA